MQATFSNLPNSTILDAIARTLFVTAWADAEEQAGRHYPGQELMDVAPETPSEARDAALYFVGRLEQANDRMSVEALLWAAWRSDGNPEPTDETVIPDDYRKDFGHYLVMQALGHGVSWEDNHRPVTWTDIGRTTGLVVPHIEGLYVDPE